MKVSVSESWCRPLSPLLWSCKCDRSLSAVVTLDPSSSRPLMWVGGLAITNSVSTAAIVFFFSMFSMSTCSRTVGCLSGFAGAVSSFFLGSCSRIELFLTSSRATSWSLDVSRALEAPGGGEVAASLVLEILLFCWPNLFLSLVFRPVPGPVCCRSPSDFEGSKSSLSRSLCSSALAF